MEEKPLEGQLHRSLIKEGLKVLEQTLWTVMKIKPDAFKRDRYVCDPYQSPWICYLECDSGVKWLFW